VTPLDPVTVGVAPAKQPILVVDRLEKRFPLGRSAGDVVGRRARRSIVAVDGVSLHLLPNEVLGVVGESGCGKSTLARCLVGLYAPDGGRIVFDGHDVGKPSRELARELHRRVQMVFQDPFTSLNPLIPIGAAILEAGKVHGRVNGDAAAFTGHYLDLVGLPRSMADRRPRALSGGQRQRAAIARALAVGPDVLIADEAVSALDVSIQAQILNLFERLSAELGLAMIFISHDLAVVSHIADRVAIMYLGRIVEEGPVDSVFRSPRHPYTRALLDSHPDPFATRRTIDIAPIAGDVPSPIAIPTGCRFRGRCQFREEVCVTDDPSLRLVAGDSHRAACHVLPFGGG
jgi:oligopeptide/dipeptide ABC transporter ATP-binding protein